TWRDGSANR
ncbi:unnamed protein product, partial [Rotaria sp. Silwood1]